MFKKLVQLSVAKKLLLIVAFAAVAMVGFVAYSEQPVFCNSCHIMDPYYRSWQASAHAEVNCLECHLQPGFVGHVKGKINGLAQAVDCVVGRVGTKPSATVLDESCLRSDCHSLAELLDDKIENEQYLFTHRDHVGKSSAEFAGLQVTCGTCHNHFEGDSHFSVNTQACYACHFLEDADNPVRLADTKCQSCHHVPTETVRRGDIEIDHDDFLAYDASCQLSCHKKQLEIVSAVSANSCLNCHDERMSEPVDVGELHAQHSGGERVECFACHGEVDHESKMGETVADMLDCQSCHSDTHSAQRAIYLAKDEPVHDRPESKVLSPMFLGHVECSACHVAAVEETAGVLDSFGTVRRAVPEACDHCHEPGTGERYIPFWQDSIKKLYARVEAKVTARGDEIKQGDATVSPARLRDYEMATALLEAVVADGSWGVHNLKYTEAMLLRAARLVDESEEVAYETR